jgi:hypothetical protein
MTRSPTATTPPITRSPYRLGKSNTPIPAFHGQMTVVAGGNTFAGDGRLTLSWLPRPELQFELEAFALPVDPSTISIRGAARPAGVNINQVRGTGVGTRTSGTLIERLTRGAGTQLKSVVFHVANFHGFRGDYVADRRGRIAASRITLDSDGWMIELDCRMDDQDVLDALKRTSGYGVTHVGRLRRADGSTFAADDCLGVLQALGVLLSFARGSRTEPFLLVGEDAAGHVRWRSWERPLVARWQRRGTWFSPNDPRSLLPAFEGVMRRWADPHSREVLRRLIYLLVEGQMSFEPGLILSQAALELLSWQQLVIESRAISAAGHEKLEAADRLRLLLNAARVPLEIPDSMRELIALAKQLSLTDGPAALTYLRNRWVHPPRKGALESGRGEIGQAWALAQWYGDLATLRWLGFEGDYAPRVRPGSERVPWA